jgi:hypothetical protein
MATGAEEGMATGTEEGLATGAEEGIGSSETTGAGGAAMPWETIGTGKLLRAWVGVAMWDSTGISAIAALVGVGLVLGMTGYVGSAFTVGTAGTAGVSSVSGMAGPGIIGALGTSGLFIAMACSGSGMEGSAMSAWVEGLLDIFADSACSIICMAAGKGLSSPSSSVSSRLEGPIGLKG